MATATATEVAPAQPSTDEPPTDHSAPQPEIVASDQLPEIRESQWRIVDMPMVRIVRNPDNPRHDAAALPGIVENLRLDGTAGLIAPVVVVPWDDADGYYVLIDGEQRYLSGEEANLDYIPTIIRDDLRGKADQIVNMLRQIHRTGLTDTQKSRAIEQLALLDLTDEDIAQRLAYDPAEVRAARSLARLPKALAEQSETLGLSFEQNELLDSFTETGDEDAVTRLMAAAPTGPIEFSRVAATIQRQRASEATFAARRAELAGAGIRLIASAPQWDDKTAARLTELRTGDGKPITAAEHVNCPGHAVHLRPGSNIDPAETVYCLTWRAARHRKNDGSRTPGPMSEKEKADRRRTIDNNRDLEIANEVRRSEFLPQFLAATKPPKGTARYLATALTLRWGIVDREWKDARGMLEKLLHPGKPTQHQRNFMAGRPTEARCTVLTVASVVAAVESTIKRHSWRDSSALIAATFAFYAANGYPLSRVEQEMVDAMAGNTSRTSVTVAPVPNRTPLQLVPADEPDEAEDDADEDDEQPQEPHALTTIEAHPDEDEDDYPMADAA